MDHGIIAASPVLWTTQLCIGVDCYDVYHGHIINTDISKTKLLILKYMLFHKKTTQNSLKHPGYLLKQTTATAEDLNQMVPYEIVHQNAAICICSKV